MWARKDVAVSSCPKSLISAESEALVEEFLVRRRLGVKDLATLSARQVEAEDGAPAELDELPRARLLDDDEGIVIEAGE